MPKTSPLVPALAREYCRRYKMKITRKQLKALEACEEGMDYFDTLAPSGEYTFDCTREWQLEFIQSDGRRWWGWLVGNGVVPAWAMRKADLSSANLRYADLRNANLRYANLRDADWSSADLRNANLRNANLRDANLFGADLRFANLFDANLSGANLSDADLFRADLRDADITNAIGLSDETRADLIESGAVEDAKD